MFPPDSQFELCGFLRQLMKSLRFLGEKSAAMLHSPTANGCHPTNTKGKERKALDSDRILQLFFARQNCEPVS